MNTLTATLEILPFNTAVPPLALVGGKGVNLVKMVQAGLPVPDGFLLTTAVYRQFVAHNQLDNAITAVLATTPRDDPDALSAASAEIRARFAAGIMPLDLRQTLLAAYAQRPGPVAVRSSATAEDLPDMSFAGQQDTFLNVQGDAAFLQAVVDCWSSLWTARAIGYRSRNAIDHSDVALAVVVQDMVASVASGVLFTANPLSGQRSQTVIDATLGLGEALVSGLVQPDHYVVDATNGRILSKQIGDKATVMHGTAGGGLVTTTGKNSQQAIPDAVILALAAMGQQTAVFFGTPQDIEWGWANDTLYLLQSRPITSLYPLPAALPGDDVRLLFSFGAVQGVLDPFTPLGRDTIKGVMGNGSVLFGRPYRFEEQTLVQEAGERLFIDLSGMMRHRLGRRLARQFLTIAEPVTAQIWQQLLADPRFQPQGGFSLRQARAIAHFGRKMLPQLWRAWRRPDAVRQDAQTLLAAKLAAYQQRFAQADGLAAQMALYEQSLGDLFPVVLPTLMPPVLVGFLSWRLLHKLVDGLPHAPDATLLTRGLAHNVTTQMDLALWQAAQTIRADETAAAWLLAQSAETAAALYQAQSPDLPPAVATALADFLARYGMRGLGEIDFGRWRWREDPTPVVQTLQSYLSITDAALAPSAVFARGEAAAATAVADITQAVRGTVGGRIKAWLVPKLAYRMRALSGLRESPKFYIIQMFGLARAAFLQSGAKLVAQGVLAQPDDLFFLHVPELRALAAGEPRDWLALVAERRAANAREQRRRQIPRLLLSDGEAFYESTAVSHDDNALSGAPVSPGVVEGTVRVVLSPHNAQLQSGEILVCPATDPAWTPLFLAAGGLVMEVGGLMTHGSVVAREYGIPAVVGVRQATTRLQTGQRVRVDGSRGTVTIL